VRRALLFFFLFWPLGARAQALLAGSEYYDSFQTMASVVIMKAAGNEAGRDYLISTGHILPKNEQSLPIIVIARGQEPESGAEFRFPAYPRTYWTFSENIATLEELRAGAEPSPSPSPTPTPEKVSPTPTVATTPSPMPKKKGHHKSSAIQWHKVNGAWKWQPLEPGQFKGWPTGASAPDGSRGP
jgi:hypothetical protein